MNNTLPNSFTLRFFNPAPLGKADSVYLFDSGAEPTSTTIITTQVNGVTYEEILQSQNGAVYQINGLTISQEQIMKLEPKKLIQVERLLNNP